MYQTPALYLKRSGIVCQGFSDADPLQNCRLTSRCYNQAASLGDFLKRISLIQRGTRLCPLSTRLVHVPPPSGGRVGGGNSADGRSPRSPRPPARHPSSPPPAGGRDTPPTTLLREISVKQPPIWQKAREEVVSSRYKLSRKSPKSVHQGSTASPGSGGLPVYSSRATGRRCAPRGEKRRGRPGRGASCKPASPCARYRVRQRRTVWR